MSYIWRFKMVINQYLGTFFANNMIKFYFIHGFNKYSSIHEILNYNPQDLKEAKEEAMGIERMDK